MKKIIFQIIGGMVALWLGILFIPGVQMATENILQIIIITGIVGIGIVLIRLLVTVVFFPIKFLVVNGLIFIFLVLGLRIITNFFPELVIDNNAYYWLAGIVLGVNLIASLIGKKNIK